MTDLVFTTQKKLLADDVTMFRTLRPSTLMRWIQEISIAHTEALGAGRAKTLDKGALWVIARLKLKIERLPEYDETVTLESWAGDTMHVLFPRHYLLSDADGKPLVKAAAVWLLMDAGERKMTFPDKYGVKVPGVKRGCELSLPAGLSFERQDEHSVFEVRYSQVDINTHMNNSKYVDCMEDVLGGEYLSENALDELEIEYKSEIKLGAKVDLGWTLNGGTLSMSGSVLNKPCFEIKAMFKKKA